MPSFARVMPAISVFMWWFPSSQVYRPRFLRSKTLCLLARRAVLGVTVAVILVHLLDDLVLEFPIWTFCDLGQVKILDRITIRAELEPAAQRVVFGLLHRGRDRILCTDF